ncbi:MAG: hypothetical protein PHH08_01410 [Candidatus ainarchaeum sp.]|nr:hypothetical protein [Candidatus ainarchaeum sp.]
MPRLSIEGDHAKVELLSRRRQKKLGFRPEPRLVKRVSGKRLRFAYSLGMSLAHVLFPKNFPEIVASGRGRKTTYSAAIELDAKSQAAINDWYAFHMRTANFVLHEKRLKRMGIDEKADALNSCGIIVNKKPMNVGVTQKGSLVFFEVVNVNVQLLEAKIRVLPESLKKKQAARLLSALKKIYNGQNEIFVHN